jgi:hypothetical protein
MKQHLLAILAILVVTAGLLMSCSQPTTTPTIPSASPGVTQDWQSYDNESLGIAFRYPETYTVLLDDPINSGIQLESESIFLTMIANPLSDRSVKMLAEELHDKGFRESGRIQIQKGFWKGLRLQGKVTKIGVPTVDEVVYMVEAPSSSFFTCLAFSTGMSPDFAEVDMIWDSLTLQFDSFAMPPALLDETPMATLQPKGQGYSLRYPQAWQAVVVSNGLVFVSDPDNPDAFVMSILKTQPPEANIDEAISNALDALYVFDDVVLHSQHEVSLSGAQDAVVLAGSARFADGSHAVFRILLVVTKDSTYKVDVIADAAKWESLSPVFDEIFNSFTIEFPQ